MRITIEQVKKLKASGEKIAVLTAYDYPTARIVDDAGVPMLTVTTAHSPRRRSNTFKGVSSLEPLGCPKGGHARNAASPLHGFTYLNLRK